MRSFHDSLSLALELTVKSWLSLLLAARWACTLEGEPIDENRGYDRRLCEKLRSIRAGGYGAHFVNHKYGKRSISERVSAVGFELPPVAFMVGVAHSVYAYRLTHKMVSLLLPAQYFFKEMAWCLGYVHSHLDKYGHVQA